MESAFILGGSSGAATADYLPWASLSAGNATHAWDFLTDQARFNSIDVGPLANTPGWSYTRADSQNAYAQTSAGVLTPFATGVLRRTDKGVLIEGARTNLCLQSQTFDNASWAKTNCTVTADQVAAPDGTTTGDKIEAAAGAAGGCQIYQAWTATATSFVYSVFVKQGSGATDANKISIFNNTTATVLAGGTLDYSTGIYTQTTGSGATVQTLANGWYRVSLPVSSGVSISDVIRVYAGFTGSAETPAEYCYGWGAQIEAGVTFPSSYIPTTTASATRAADVLTVPVSGLDYPLSLFAETDLVTLAGGSVSQGYFQIDDSSNSNRALLYGTNGGSQGSRMFCATAGVQQALPTVGALATGVRKTAGRCSLNSFQVAGNGTLATEDTSGTVPATPNRLMFGKDNSTGTELFGYLRRAAIWPRALTDAELQSVTT